MGLEGTVEKAILAFRESQRIRKWTGLLAEADEYFKHTPEAWCGHSPAGTNHTYQPGNGCPTSSFTE